MNRLKEIEERLSAIEDEMNADGADLDALEKEVRALKAEKNTLEQAAEKRTNLLKEIAEGRTGKVVSTIKETRTTEFDKETVRSTEEYRSAWAKTLQRKTLTDIEKRAYAISDVVNAVPEIVANKMFESMKKIAPMISEITLLRVPGNIKFMAEGTNNAAAKHTENAAITPAADSIISVTLTGYEFAKIIRISKSVSEMSVGAFEDWLVSMLARDIARSIDNYILNDSINGIAAGTFTTNTNQIVNTQGYTYKNIIDLIALLPASYDADAKFLMHKSVLWGKIANITDSQGKPILLRDMENGFKPTILGYPVIVDEYVTTANNAIYFGNFTEGVVGNMSKDIEVERSSESGFLNGSVDFRGFAIFDSKVAQSAAIVRAVTTTA